MTKEEYLYVKGMSKPELLSVLQLAWRKEYDAKNISKASEIAYVYLLVIEGELNFLFE